MPYPRRSDIPDDEVQRLYFEEHWSIARIAERFQANWDTIQLRVRESGRTRHRPQRPFPSELLKDLYLKERLTGHQIAERLGEAQATVYRRLKALGISRPRGRKRSVLDGLETGHSVRVPIEVSRRLTGIRLREQAKNRGIKISIASHGEKHLVVTRLPANGRQDSERLERIRHLYCEKKWRARSIAEEIGISESQVYRIMRAAGIKIDPKGKRDPAPKLRKSTLVRLYEEERLSVPAIAKKIRTTEQQVARELDRHGIWPGARVPCRVEYSKVMELPLWGELVVETDRCEPSTKLLREAKWFNVRVVARKDGPDRYRIIRLPFITREVVERMWKEEPFRTKIAKKLRTLPDKIAHLIPKKS